MKALIVAGAMALAACAPMADVPIGISGGEVVIVAVVETERALPDQLPVILVSPGAAVIIPQLSSTEVLVGWRLAPGYLVDPDGAPYTIGEVVVRRVDGPAVPGFGDCGRCPAQNIAGERQIIHPGASCAFAIQDPQARIEVLAGDETKRDRALAIATHGVRFDWPGKCRCQPPREVAPEIDLVPVAPGRSTYPHAGMAETPDGHIALIDERHAVVIDPQGGSVTSSVVPIQDPIVLAVAGGTNEIFVAAYANTTDGVTWWKTDTALSRWRELEMIATSRFTPEHGVPLTGVPGGFVVTGAIRLPSFTNQPIVMACGPSEAGDATECRELAHSLTQIDPDEVFRWLFRLPDDSWVTAGNTGTFIHLDRVAPASTLLSAQTFPLMETPTHAIADGVTRTGAGPEIAWRLRRLDALRGSDGTLDGITKIIGMTVVGQSLLMCLHTQDKRLLAVRRRFVRSELGSADDGRENAGFEVLACRRGGECGQMVTTGTITEIPFLGRVDDGGTEHLRFDESGLIGSPDQANLSCAMVPAARGPTRSTNDLVRFTQWRPERWIGSTPAGRAVVGEPGRSPRVVYGSPVDRPDWDALARDDRTDEVWAFGPPGQVGRVLEGEMTVEPLPGLPAIRAAAVDHSAPASTSFVVVAMSGDVFRVNRTPGATAVERVDIPVSMMVPSHAFLISEAAPGVFVIGMSPRALWRVIGDEVTPIEMSFDDPATPEQEAAPPLRENCIPGRALEYNIPGYRRPLELRALSSAEGVTWAVGCSATIYRVSVFGPRPKASRFSIEPLFLRGLGRESSGAAALSVDARCADSLMVGLTRFESNLSSLGAFVEVSPTLTPEEERASAREPGIALSALAGGELSRLKELQVGDTLGIMYEHSPPAFAIAGNATQAVRGGIGRFTGDAFRIGAATRAVVETDEGGFVLSVEGGEVLASPP